VRRFFLGLVDSLILFVTMSLALSVAGVMPLLPSQRLAEGALCKKCAAPATCGPGGIVGFCSYGPGQFTGMCVPGCCFCTVGKTCLGTFIPTVPPPEVPGAPCNVARGC
jgi:hypothetical protein